MKRNYKSVAAAVKAAVNGGVFVFASTSPEITEAANAVSLLKKYEYSSFGCKSCGTSMVSTSASSPFCTTCGSQDVVKTAEKASMTLTSDEQLAAVQCTGCSSTVILDGKVFAAAHGKVHCSVCGSGLNTKALAEDPKDMDDETNVEPSDLKGKEAPDPKKEFHGASNEPADPQEFEGTGQPGMETPGTPESASDDGDDEIDPDSLDDLEIDQGDDDETEEADAEEVVEDEFVSEADFGEGEGDADPVVDAEEVESTSDEALDSLFDVEDGDEMADVAEIEDQSELSFVRSGTRLLAMVGPFVVASLSEKNAGANADIMYSPALQRAVRSYAVKKGLRAALTDHAFKPVRVKTLTKAALNNEVKKIKASVVQQTKASRSVFEESLAIASVGLARNAWKATPNPLIASFATVLTDLGMGEGQAKKVSARVFRTAGVEYAKALLETADRISNRSAKSRQEFAEMLEMTTETASEEEFGDEGDDDLDFSDVTSTQNITSRFERAGVVNPVVKVKPVAGSKVSAAVIEALNSGKPLLFSNF